MHVKRSSVLLSIGILGLALAGFFFYQATKVAQNPDPNHTHADFAIWVNGTHLDFSGDQYMSGISTDPNSHPTEGLKKYLHLHDGNGHVMHRHKPGLTVGEFLGSIGVPATAECITIDQTQFAKLDAGWVSDFGVKPELCNNGKFHWSMIVNGTLQELNPEYDFQDGDKILFSYGASDTAWEDQWKDMSDDACRYSQTCPWKGKPPTENCIADPEVPCVVQ